MINDLNRIKRILSARLGTEIPKFLKGANFKGVENGTNVYSNDGLNWYLDRNLTNLYKANYPNIISTSINAGINLGGQDYYNSDVTSNDYLFFERINIPIYDNSFTDSFQDTQSLNREQSNNRATNPVNVVNSLDQKTTVPIINTIPTNIPKRTITHSEDNLKLAKEDRKLGRQSRKEIKANNYSEENAQKGQAFMAGMDAISAVGGAIGAAQQATDSDLTKGISAGYDGVANAVSGLGPYGLVIGGAMKALGALGDMSQAMGGGTDQMSKLDSWMDSPLLSWNIGMLNGFAGKNSNAFGADQDILAKAGSSYGGTTSTIMDAAESADKKYGLFSWKSRKKANEVIAKAQSQLNLMGDIANNATDLRLAVQSMGEQAGLAYSMMTDGGYNQKYTYAAKQGGILEWEPDAKLEWEPQIELNWELPTFKEGGNIDIIEELEWIPELQSGNKIELSKDVLDFYKDYDLTSVNVVLSDSPRTEGDTIYINNDEDAIHELWHYLSQNKPNEAYKEYYDNLTDDKIIRFGGDLKFVKRFENDPGYFYHPSELEARIKAAKFKTKGQNYTKEFFQNLRNNENQYGNNMRDLLHMYNDDNLVKIFSLKKGGSLGNSDIPEIEETNLKNVIPEGALHKNKHHMEHAEGLTKKGIPVIDENGEQQAEIEHSEIIFTLEVTKKLEEYYEIFYSEESTNKEKELAALDAGKLLVYQILENTDDRTNLIDSCKKGGTLTLKKSTDDLIEEALEWIPQITIIEEIVEEPKKESKKLSEKELMKEAIKEVLIELLTK